MSEKYKFHDLYNMYLINQTRCKHAKAGLVIFMILLVSCSKTENNEKEFLNACIKFEHVGISNKMMYSIVISDKETLCDLDFKYPEDSNYVYKIIVTSNTLSLLGKYVKSNALITDMEYVKNDVVCSGYEVSFVNDGEVLSNYYILEKEDYYSYFNGLKNLLKADKESEKLINILDEKFDERDFICIPVE